MRGNQRHSSTVVGLVLAVVSGVVKPAGSVDGVIEINQASALAGSVTASDEPGFPVTIATSGSYRLTGNLTVATASDVGIIITAANVTIDLNGFALSGPVSCTGTPADCDDPTENGDGIASSAANVTVMNGTVQGLGHFGITLVGTASRVERVRAIGNAADGIQAITVIDSEGVGNGQNGISVLTNGLAQGNRASRNGNDGIVAASRTQLVGNTTMQNGGDGVDGSNWVFVTTHNTVGNGGFGIEMFNGGFSNVHAFFNNPPNSCVNDQISGGVDMGNNSCCAGVCP